MSGRYKWSSAVTARRRRSFVLIAMAAVMVPAAIAWACNPQAHISLNNSSYGPGESISVSGSYFNSSSCGCTVSTSGSSTSASGSAWSTTLTAPSQPGSYTVVASSGAPDNVTRTASFQVVDQTASGPVSSNQGSSGQSFKEPKVGGVSEKVGGVSGGGGSVDSGSGEQAFAGSVAAAPGGGSFFSGGSVGSSSSTTTAQPSERAAVSDVWSGYAAGKTPSLTSGAAVPDGDTGSELSLGIVLLAIGLLALVAGLTTAEVMRRRAQVR